LHLRDKKKTFQNKKKNPPCFEIFLPIAREKKEKMRKEKQRKSNTLTGQIVIHLVRALPERESIVFVNRGKSSLFYKKQYQE